MKNMRYAKEPYIRWGCSQPSYKHHMEDCLTLTSCRTAFNREHKMFSRAIDFMVEFSAWIHFHFQYLAKHHGAEHWSTGAPACAGDFGDFGNHDSHLIQMLVRSLIHNTIHFTFAWWNYFFDTRGMQHCFSVGGDYNKGFHIHNEYCKIWYSNVLQIYYNPR